MKIWRAGDSSCNVDLAIRRRNNRLSELTDIERLIAAGGAIGTARRSCNMAQALHEHDHLYNEEENQNMNRKGNF